MKFVSVFLFFYIFFYEVYTSQDHPEIRGISGSKIKKKNNEAQMVGGLEGDRFHEVENVIKQPFLDRQIDEPWHKKPGHFELKKLWENNAGNINDELKPTKIKHRFYKASRDGSDASNKPLEENNIFLLPQKGLDMRKMPKIKTTSNWNNENTKTTDLKSLLLRVKKYEPKAELSFGQLPTKLSNRRRKRQETTSEGNSEKPPEGNSEKPPEGNSEKPPEGNSEKPSEGNSEKPSEGNSEKPSEGNSEKPSEGMPKKPSDGTTKENTNSQTDSQKLDEVLKQLNKTLELLGCDDDYYGDYDYLYDLMKIFFS